MTATLTPIQIALEALAEAQSHIASSRLLCGDTNRPQWDRYQNAIDVLTAQTPTPPELAALAKSLASGVLEELSSECRCHAGFKCRNLTDPNCEFCNTNAEELRGLADQILVTI
jgi:ParB-like chromosome segregation protein Spo0J